VLRLPALGNGAGATRRRGPFGGFIALALACATEASAAPEVFQVEPEFSSAEFAVSYFGFARQHGRFGRTEGTIVLDPEDHTGSVDLVVDATTIDTGWSLRDAWLRSEHMFDVARFPVVRFRATQFVFNQTRLIGISGTLTVRDITRPVALRIQHMRCVPEGDSAHESCGAGVASTIKRSDFGMTSALGLVSDEVDLTFHVTAYRAQPQARLVQPEANQLAPAK
jgi:polyisoprenoid-binding protein YceI